MSRIKKITCVTGTRADYPRVKAVLKEIRRRKEIKLDLIVTGSHLLPQYGFSVSEILSDGIPIFAEVPMYEGDFDTPLGMAQACARCLSGVAQKLEESSPDLVLLTVDRVETLAAACAASLMNFPIAHIQGGEVTGTIDESIRHAVTKLSHIHFPATEDAGERIRLMGEAENRIHIVGCPYVDVIIGARFPKKNVLAKKYGFDSKANIIIFTQHPVTTEYGRGPEQVRETIAALEHFRDHQVIAFFSNADAGGREIIGEIEKLDNLTLIPNMESNDFLGLMASAKVMIGNSSAGIREAPSFGLPVVNIGTRQNGRLRAKNVVDVVHESSEITAGIEKALYDIEFLKELNDTKNPYGDGKSAKRIVDILSNVEVDESLIQKEIAYDI